MLVLVFPEKEKKRKKKKYIYLLSKGTPLLLGVGSFGKDTGKPAPEKG